MGKPALAPELGASDVEQRPRLCSLSLTTGWKLSHPVFLGIVKWLGAVGVLWQKGNQILLEAFLS